MVKLDLDPISVKDSSKCTKSRLIEHSKTKIVTHFENEVGPWVLQSSIQQTYNLQKFRTTRTELIHNQSHIVSAFSILAAVVFVERWTEALRSDLVFKHPRLRNNFLSGMFYWM